MPRLPTLNRPRSKWYDGGRGPRALPRPGAGSAAPAGRPGTDARPVAARPAARARTLSPPQLLAPVRQIDDGGGAGAAPAPGRAGGAGAAGGAVGAAEPGAVSQ